MIKLGRNSSWSRVQFQVGPKRLEFDLSRRLAQHYLLYAGHGITIIASSSSLSKRACRLRISPAFQAFARMLTLLLLDILNSRLSRFDAICSSTWKGQGTGLLFVSTTGATQISYGESDAHPPNSIIYKLVRTLIPNPSLWENICESQHQLDLEAAFRR